MKTCIFCKNDCSGKKRAKEHIVPQHLQKKFQWMKESLHQAHSKAVKDDFAGGHISILDVDRKLTYSSFLAGNVCERCNSGWMSQLETDVQNFIYKLVDGTKKVNSCNENEIHSLSLWAFKTCAALSSSLDAPQNYLLPAHAHQFYESESKNIPNKISVFALSAKSKDLLWSLSPTWHIKTVKNYPEELLVELNKTSYKIFLQLGHLMLITCFWPIMSVQYSSENWGVVQLSGEEFILLDDVDSRSFFDEESEQFLMSIGAVI